MPKIITKKKRFLKKSIELNILKQYRNLKLYKNTEWTSDSIKYISNTLALTFITSINILIVQVVEGEGNSLGYYSAILTITSVILLIPVALSSIIKSNAVALINDNNLTVNNTCYIFKNMLSL